MAAQPAAALLPALLRCYSCSAALLQWLMRGSSSAEASDGDGSGGGGDDGDGAAQRKYRNTG